MHMYIYIYIYQDIYYRSGHALKLRPAEKFVARWKVGPAHPPGMGPGS